MQICESRNDRPVLITSGSRATTTTVATTPVEETRCRRASGTRMAARDSSLGFRDSVVALVGTGAVAGIREGLAGFADPIAFFLVGVLTMGAAVARSGLAERIAHQLLAHGRGRAGALYLHLLLAMPPLTLLLPSASARTGILVHVYDQALELARVPRGAPLEVPDARETIDAHLQLLGWFRARRRPIVFTRFIAGPAPTLMWKWSPAIAPPTRCWRAPRSRTRKAC